VLYLAEVQKKSGFIGSGKAEFKLIACQRSEQNWSAVPGDEIVPAPDDAAYNAGALVMVELNSNRLIQRHYEAGRSLVSILQNFSSLSKKFKTQEDEIEQWKQSLTYQSQELNRREMEIEARQEALEQAEADLEKVEAQREAVDKAKTEVESLRQEYERKQSELEGAWAHLNGELQKLEEKQEELQTQTGLDEAQTRQIQEALARLTGTVIPTDDIRQQIHTVLDLVNHQQTTLTAFWQTYETAQSEVTEKNAIVEQKQGILEQKWQELQSAQDVLTDLKTALKCNQTLLDTQHNQSQALSEQLQKQSSLYQQVYDLLNTGDQVRLSKKVDVAALEAMQLDALEAVVNDLETDLGKMSRFVSDQEEELKLQQEAIDDIKTKIETANEYDRLQLETEMAEEQDRYRMLNETLVGQRRNLVEREEVLSQHRAVLLRRQGVSTDEGTLDSAGLEPILENIDTLRQKLTGEIQAINDAIATLQAEGNALKQKIEDQIETLKLIKADLRSTESELITLQTEAASLASKIDTYASFLQSSQDQLNQLKQQLEETASITAKFQEASDYQLQAISDIQQTIHNLAAEPMATAP
jgi:chromosome segregation ATPase